MPLGAAKTAEELASHLFADNPANFLLEGDCKTAFQTQLPPIAVVVEELRQHSNTRILPGRKPEEFPFGVLETCSGGSHLNTTEDEKEFAEQFRQLPIDEALATSFTLANFQLDCFMEEGQFLSCLRKQTVDPWKQFLQASGFSFSRCTPYIFVSGPGDVGAFHHDISHVVAWQVEGTKRFCSFHEPRRWHTQEQRQKLGTEVTMPGGVTEGDVQSVVMGPGCVLMNQLLTPHWVQNPTAEACWSINISHGGLKHHTHGLCQHERELTEFLQRNPAAAARFDVKKGWKAKHQKKDDDTTNQESSGSVTSVKGLQPSQAAISTGCKKQRLSQPPQNSSS